MHLKGKVAFAFALGLSYIALAQNGRKSPAVDVSTPNLGLNEKAEDVCEVDFRNSRMFGYKGWNVRLKNGRYEQKDDGLYDSTELYDVFCFSDAKDGGHRALVVTNWESCGGSCSSTDIVQVFELRHANPVIAQQLLFDSDGKGTGAKFDKDSLTLTITGRSDDGSPHCCAENVDVVSYRWQQQKFIQIGYKRVPAPR
jgi:hypothetical protein